MFLLVIKKDSNLKVYPVSPLVIEIEREFCAQQRVVEDEKNKGEFVDKKSVVGIFSSS